MVSEITEKERVSYENFKQVTAYCVIANIFFASKMRSMRWLPACMMAPIFSISADIVSERAEKFINYFVPDEFKDDTEAYFDKNPRFQVIFMVTFVALTVISAAILTQGSLLLIARSAPFKSSVKLAALDFIPHFIFYFNQGEPVENQD